MGVSCPLDMAGRSWGPCAAPGSPRSAPLSSFVVPRLVVTAVCVLVGVWSVIGPVCMCERPNAHEWMRGRIQHWLFSLVCSLAITERAIWQLRRSKTLLPLPARPRVAAYPIPPSAIKSIPCRALSTKCYTHLRGQLSSTSTLIMHRVGRSPYLRRGCTVATRLLDAPPPVRGWAGRGGQVRWAKSDARGQRKGRPPPWAGHGQWVGLDDV